MKFGYLGKSMLCLLLVPPINAISQIQVDCNLQKFALVQKVPSYDLFLMPGSDFVRPGLGTRVNLNIGIGHTFAALKKNPIGDEVTFSYTYENSGSHGFWYTGYGSHTESLGIMKNFPVYKQLSGYSWSQVGITSSTGISHGIQNRLYSGDSMGLAYHFDSHNAIWAQESYTKIVTIPWYTSTNIGYVFSF